MYVCMYVFVIAVLVGVKWYVVMVLFCISLMTSIVSLVICISSLEKYIFESFADFLIGFFCFKHGLL